MTDPSGFSVQVDQNVHLPVGGTDVDAVVAVAATGQGTHASAAEALEMIVIDCSGSMSGDKIHAARQATVAAIRALRHGVRFVVIAGTHRARVVFPPDGIPVAAHDASRKAGIDAVRGLAAGGGTAFSTWLRLAHGIAHRHPEAIRHTILLTDGQNNERDQLEAALETCAGAFTADCRGVGTDWAVAELRRIASALLGTVDIVAEPAGLADDFRAIMERAMGKSRAAVRLRLQTPREAVVRFVKQVGPAIEDLTGRRVEVDALRGDYPLGSWGDESRDYHIGIRLPPGPVGADVRAALVTILEGDMALAKGAIRATWTEDVALNTAINPRVAGYTDQAELAAALDAGIAAMKAGDTALAEERLGTAVRLAAETGHQDTARLLAQIVEVDEGSGTVRLRGEATEEDWMTADARSQRTVPVWERS